MAPKKPSPLPSPIPIGNCEVSVEAKNFKVESNQNTLRISLSRYAKINISVVEDTCKKGSNDQKQHSSSEDNGNCYFVLVNPKDGDAQSKSMLQEVLNIYMKELPTMNYAANTGKESKFLERCVLNGKYCTLLLKFRSEEGPEEVVAAITYQIIPADTQYAEVPLAAVSSIYQQKGVGRHTYMELRKRLQSVGIRSIFCWGDKESEGFWLKQGFVSVGEVNTKGRARKLPIKADIRRALCLPGGSTLMVSHLKTKNPVNAKDSVMLSFLKSLQKLPPSEAVQNQEIGGIALRYDSPKEVNQKSDGTVDAQPKEMLKDNFLMDGKQNRAVSAANMGCRDVACLKGFESGTSVINLEISQFGADGDKPFSCSALGSRKRTWEASCTPLQSKKVKGGYLKDCQLNSGDHVSGCNGANNCCLERSSQAISRTKPLEEFTPRDPLGYSVLEMNPHEYRPGNMTSEENGCEELLSRRDVFRIMLMNIADDAKKSNLTKIIEELGGTVTSDGGLCTHVVTGKVRKTLNFCTALCSGAWIITPSWLKESFRKCRFVAEESYILEDEDYELKYRAELKNVIRRARLYPHALLKGYDICLAAHVQPPISTLSAIVRTAGGNVIRDLNKVKIPQKTIFVASEEDMEGALSAVKKGILTFSNEWLINCIMRQELDLDAPKFAESL